MSKAARRICIVDLDGVVFDVSQRLAIAESEARGDKKRFWDIFLREDLIELDKPRKAGVEAVFRCIENGYEVLFLTGRPGSLLDKTIEQLERLGITLGRGVYLVMRSSRGSKNPFEPPITIPRMHDKTSSKIYKLKVLDEISKSYEIVEIHEDDEEILKELWKRHPDARLYLHIDDGYRIYSGGKRLF